MGLPGLTTSQMVEVDRIMMKGLNIPLELMMEHAGHNLARLALNLSHKKTFRIVAGSGSNGGGGLVAARKLSGWGYETEIVLPKGRKIMRDIPKFQLERAENLGVTVFDDVQSLPHDRNITVLDSYLGYGFIPREDEVSDAVFTYLRSESDIISLDVPSGLDSTSGESQSQLRPKATMTIAFLKIGLLLSSRELVGDVYVVDIGVPKEVYLSKLGLTWDAQYSTKDLDLLYTAFSKDPLQKASVSESSWSIDKR
jgi:NAD(P)H-hydrate epimerase